MTAFGTPQTAGPPSRLYGRAVTKDPATGHLALGESLGVATLRFS
jgi:hypothetical protein